MPDLYDALVEYGWNERDMLEFTQDYQSKGLDEAIRLYDDVEFEEELLGCVKAWEPNLVVKLIPSRIVNSCGHCYFFQQLGSRWCNKAQKSLEMSSQHKVPNWCPLEDAAMPILPKPKEELGPRILDLG